MAKVVIEKPNLDMDPMFGPHRMENGKLPQQQGQMPPEIPGGQQMGVGGYQPQMGGGGEYLQGGGGGQGYPNEMNEFFQVKSMKNFEKIECGLYVVFLRPELGPIYEASGRIYTCPTST